MLTGEQKAKVKYFAAEYDIYIDVPETIVTDDDVVIPVSNDTTGDDSNEGGSDS